LGEALVASGQVDAVALERVAAEVEAELEEAVEFARNSPDPSPEQALEDVYA
jgi:pyruvate dehydrogenase E1 component alpha subunit